MRNRRVALVLAAALAAAACDMGEPVPDTSFLQASVEGARAVEFEGSARFSDGYDPRRPAAPRWFTISSVGRGSSANDFIQFMYGDTVLPAPGVYAIGRTGDTFRANFQRLQGWATVESFAAWEGELEIVHAAADSLVGSFRFHAFRNCTANSPGPGATCTTEHRPDAPVIEVTGSFDARPARGGLRF